MAEDSGRIVGILELLVLHGFERQRPCKFVRHQQPGIDLEDYYRRKWLETYQSFQSRPVFRGVDRIVSFMGVGRTHARFIGVYDVVSVRPGNEGELPPGYPERHAKELVPEYFYYELRKDTSFADLEGRIIVEWGGAARSWHQWARKDKEVVAILLPGALLKPFDDYLGFTLTHSELMELTLRPDANREWRARLSAVAGVYLILDTLTGNQYVGSAYGVEGFWGRWSQYAQNGHGGDKLLVDLVTKNPGSYPAVFSYSILQVLPSSSTDEEVIRWETLYKEKLGSRRVPGRVTGLNSN